MYDINASLVSVQHCLDLGNEHFLKLYLYLGQHDEIMLIKPGGTFQEGFSFRRCTGCTREFLGAYFWECVRTQSSEVDRYNHWLSQVF